MVDFKTAMQGLLTRGYGDENVEERLAQEILLKALADCGLRENVTIKGGVVMANLTRDVRRTTLDLDIDLVRYSIDDSAVRELIDKMNCVEGVSITLVGDIVELKQQDYRGKRVFLSLQDSQGVTLEGKIDIGVHTILAAEQREQHFSVETVSSDGVDLLANTPEQVFVEKLKSLLRLGPISNRAKDVDDMLYLSGLVGRESLLALIDAYVFDDERMFEKDMSDVVRRVKRTFADAKYMARLSHRRANWLQVDPQESTRGLVDFLSSL